MLRVRVQDCLLPLVLVLAGCRAERYYGPYQLEVPGPLQQVTMVHTFTMPLADDGGQRQQLLDECLQQGDSDCRCRYPALKTGRYRSRVDYALRNQGAQSLEVMVWIGHPWPESLGRPELVPDWPEVELLAEHHHRLAPGHQVALGFTADELERAERDLALLLYPECAALDSDDLPGLETVLLGVSSEQAPGAGRVTAAFTVLLDAGGWP